MITALKKVSSSWYVPEQEKGIDNPTKFLLRPLTPSQREECMEIGTNGLSIQPSQYKKVLSFGLVGWENFVDESGVDVSFNRGNFDLIPGTLRIELALEILMRSSLGEDETKNS